jgi:hypothetical protein
LRARPEMRLVGAPERLHRDVERAIAQAAEASGSRRSPRRDRRTAAPARRRD